MRWIAFVATLLYAVNASAGDEVILDIRNRTILPAERARDLLHQYSRSTPTNIQGTWLPTDGQIRQLEARLPQAFEHEVASRHIDAASIGSYERQYGGLIINGRRIIYVNAFPQHLYLQDRRYDARLVPMVDVCDGGPRFFGVEYDPARKTFSHFEFDGELR